MDQGPPPSEAGSSTSVRSSAEAQAGYPYQYYPPTETYFPPQSGSPYYAGYQYSWPTSWPANSTYAQYRLPERSQVFPQQPDIKREEESASPSPSPEPSHREWDSAIKSFLSAAGLTQTLRGFEADMIIMNVEWEREKIPDALGKLLKTLSHLGQDVEKSDEERSLSERKLDYVHVRDGVQPESQSSINKEISLFLANNRARINESNRNEFLLTLAEKRRRLSEHSAETPSSCARTDAKPVDRDLQMKYDIAKNEEGPLRKTVKLEEPSSYDNMVNRPAQEDNESLLSNAHPGLDGRIRDIETHLAVRYVPSPPRLILDRIKFLEDHIIALEKAYPPWAALHFNQPNRGWPPPPRPTPIIVPPRMLTGSAPENVAPPPENSKGKSRMTGSKKGRGSSLHRAVMERLEVQKAKSHLAGEESMDLDQGG